MSKWNNSDQTPDEYKLFGTQLPEKRGTGVFLRTGASGETMVTFRHSLTYGDMVELGPDFDAFKWVPDDVAPYSQVVDSRCRLVGEPCVKSCDALGCLCNTSAEQCVDASGNSNEPPATGGGSESGNKSRLVIADLMEG